MLPQSFLDLQGYLGRDVPSEGPIAFMCSICCHNLSQTSRDTWAGMSLVRVPLHSCAVYAATIFPRPPGILGRDVPSEGPIAFMCSICCHNLSQTSRDTWAGMSLVRVPLHSCAVYAATIFPRPPGILDPRISTRDHTRNLFPTLVLCYGIKQAIYLSSP